jgi:hypothetical protein
VERRKRRAGGTSLLVPAAVRVEVGWDRTSPQWAFLNRALHASHVAGESLVTELLTGSPDKAVAGRNVGKAIKVRA